MDIDTICFNGIDVDEGTPAVPAMSAEAFAEQISQVVLMLPSRRQAGPINLDQCARQPCGAVTLIDPVELGNPTVAMAAPCRHLQRFDRALHKPQRPVAALEQVLWLRHDGLHLEPTSDAIRRPDTPHLDPTVSHIASTLRTLRERQPGKWLGCDARAALAKGRHELFDAIRLLRTLGNPVVDAR